MATGNLHQRVERLEAKAGGSQRIRLFEELMSFMHEAFQLLREGASLDALPHKTFEGSARSWAIDLAHKIEQRLLSGGGICVEEICWLLPAYHDAELRKLLPARVRDSIKNFLELSREGRLRIIEDGSLGGTLRVLPASDPS